VPAPALGQILAAVEHHAAKPWWKTRAIAVRVERCNKEPGIVLIPPVEVPLRDIEGAHGLAPVCTGT